MRIWTNLVVGQKFLSYLECTLIESWNLNVYYTWNYDFLNNLYIFKEEISACLVLFRIVILALSCCGTIGFTLKNDLKNKQFSKKRREWKSLSDQQCLLITEDPRNICEMIQWEFSIDQTNFELMVIHLPHSPECWI